MDSQHRIHWIGEMLRESLHAGASFIVFENPEKEKFIQFALIGREGLICDIPTTILTGGEEERLRELVPDTSRDMETGELISYQRWFNAEELHRAAELVETIFTRIFNLPEDYTLRCLSG